MRSATTVSVFFLLLLLIAPAVAGRFNRAVSVGDKVEAWRDLPGVDGRRHSFSDFQDAKLVVHLFTCNFCPCALANEDRISALERDYRNRGVRFVAFNLGKSTADTMEKMKERSKTAGWSFPYLRDDTQQVGRDFGAAVTPHVFVLSPQRTILYMGAIDDSAVDASRAKKHYLRDALDALLAGKKPRLAETRQIGCGIEYAAVQAAKKNAEKKTDDVALRVVDKEGFDKLLAKYRGKVVLVDYWATWCGPCVKQLPHTLELHHKYAKAGLVVVTLSIDEADEQAAVLKFLQGKKMTCVNLLSKYGSDDKTFDLFGIDNGAIPHYQLFDRRGKLADKFAAGDPDAPLEPEAIDLAVKRRLAEKPGE